MTNVFFVRRCIVLRMYLLFHQLFLRNVCFCRFISYLCTNLYLVLHDLFDSEKHNENVSKRFCSYRLFVFWIFPEIKRKERRPLPACLYSSVQAMFPPTDNEEEFAEWQFSEFVYGEDESWAIFRVLCVYMYMRIKYNRKF